LPHHEDWFVPRDRPARFPYWKQPPPLTERQAELYGLIRYQENEEEEDEDDFTGGGGGGGGGKIGSGGGGMASYTHYDKPYSPVCGIKTAATDDDDKEASHSNQYTSPPITNNSNCSSNPSQNGCVPCAFYT
jgi:hypothetical protein